jgi:hypothetical protein
MAEDHSWTEYLSNLKSKIKSKLPKMSLPAIIALGSWATAVALSLKAGYSPQEIAKAHGMTLTMVIDMATVLLGENPCVSDPIGCKSLTETIFTNRFRAKNSKSKKSSRKSVRKVKKSSRKAKKSSRKSTRKNARKSTRKNARKSTRKSSRKSTRKNARKSTRKSSRKIRKC